MNRTSHRTRLLATCLVLGVLAGGAPTSVGAVGPAGESGGFVDDAVFVTRGDTVEVTVSHSDTAHVFIGSDRSGFLLEVVLEGSGTDTVTIDTYTTTGSPSSFVSGASNVTLHTDQLTRPLAATEYPMNLTIGGVEQDVGLLTVEQRSEMNATTRVAPGGLLDDGSPDVATAMHHSVENETVAHGDLAVISVHESGLENALTVDDLDGDANANGIAVRFHELDPAPNTEPETLVVTEDPGFVAASDLENDRFVVTWNTSTRTLQARSNDTWRMDVVLTEANGLVAGETLLASTRVRLVEPVVQTTNPARRMFYPWEEAAVTVNGTTNLAPGTTLSVRARSPDPPFLERTAVQVTSDHRFEATLDVSRTGPGESVHVWVQEHRPETERSVVRYAETANVTFDDQVSNGDVVEVEAVNLEAGGFIEVLHNESRIGVSRHLDPGSHETVSIELDTALAESATVTAVARLDRDLDRTFTPSTDRAYLEHTDGENSESVPVTDSATIHLQGMTPTTTATPAEPSTTTPSDSITEAASTTTTRHLAARGPLVERTPIPAFAAAETDTSVPFPGWGAVVALVAAGVLVHHRGGTPP